MAEAPPENSAVKVRTAGALRTGTSRCVEAFRAQFNESFAASFTPSFTHGPHIEDELAAGTCDAEIVGLMDTAVTAGIAKGYLAPRRVRVGSIQIGVAIRQGAERPDISDMDMFIAALRSAETLIYTTAASGEYMADVLTKMGFIRRFEDKTVRYASGGEVNARLMAGTRSRELAFGVATEFLANPKVVYLGPLPKEIQNPSPYEFACLKGRESDPRVQQVLDFFDTERAREIFAATGID